MLNAFQNDDIQIFASIKNSLWAFRDFSAFLIPNNLKCFPFNFLLKLIFMPKRAESFICCSYPEKRRKQNGANRIEALLTISVWYPLRPRGNRVHHRLTHLWRFSITNFCENCPVTYNAFHAAVIAGNCLSMQYLHFVVLHTTPSVCPAFHERTREREARSEKERQNVSSNGNYAITD